MSNPVLDPKKNPNGKIFQGQACKHKSDCTNDLECAHPGTTSAETICCPNGRYYNSKSFRHFCDDLPNGYLCRSNDGCTNSQCAHPRNSIGEHTICCYSNERVYKGSKFRWFCSGQIPGSPCGVDKECASKNCGVDGKCSATKKLSFGQKIERVFLIGLIVVIAVIVIILIFKFA